MTPPTPDDARAALLDATTALLGLAPEIERRAQVLMHMSVIGQAAQFVLAFPLDDTIEPAPIFAP